MRTLQLKSQIPLDLLLNILDSSSNQRFNVQLSHLLSIYLPDRDVQGKLIENTTELIDQQINNILNWSQGCSVFHASGYYKTNDQQLIRENTTIIQVWVCETLISSILPKAITLAKSYQSTTGQETMMITLDNYLITF